MDIIGNTVISKATAKEGTVLGVEGGKVRVNFIGLGEGILIDISKLEMDPLLEEEIKKQIAETKKIKTSTSNKASKPKGNYPGGRLKKIKVSDDLSFDRAVDIANACLGRNLKGYQRGGMDINEEYYLWWPKLIKDMKCSDIRGYKNVLVGNGETLLSKNLNNKLIKDRDAKRKALVFAKDGNEPYIFRGVYTYDEENDEGVKVFKRIGDVAEFDGDPIDVRVSWEQLNE